MLTLPYDFAETPVRVSQCDLAMWFASAITLANVMWKEALNTFGFWHIYNRDEKSMPLVVTPPRMSYAEQNQTQPRT